MTSSKSKPSGEPAPILPEDRARGAVRNAMSVDVEEHFQVSAFEAIVDRATWGDHPSRVADNTERLLDLFDTVGVRATFFVLGWVAERYPEIVRSLDARGHEVGCHGFSHKLVHTQSPEEFREELARARAILQDACGQEVAGHRAASFSIGRGNLWALDVIAECGFTYDSSLFPVVHDRYGIPGGPRGLHRVRTPSGATLVELPPSTVRIGGAVLPVAGGGYLRIYPEWVNRWAIRRLNDVERMPAVVYLHPWEVDPGQPRVDALPFSTRLRHYTGLSKLRGRLERLAREFAFGTMADVIADAGEDVPVFAAGAREAS